MIEEPEEMLEEEELEVGQEEAASAAEEQRQYALAFEKIKALIAECAEGRGEREADALALAASWVELIDYANRGFADARTKRVKVAKPQEQPPMATAKPATDHGSVLGRSGFGRVEAKNFSAPIQPERVAQPEPEPAEPEAASAAISALLGELEAEQTATVVELRPRVPAEPKVAKPVPDWALADWDEPVEPVRAEPPAAVAGLALPGVAGEVQDFFLRTAMQPSEAMSLGVGLMVPTVLLSGNVIGPSGPDGCALQQTTTVLAPTSGGKKRAQDVVKQCVTAAGQQKLLGPNRFKSGGGLVRHMKENRVTLCVQDEFGLLLAKLGSVKSNQAEIEINERMREFWSEGSGSVYNSPAGAKDGDDSMMIVDARLSILGFGNREEFFDACKGIDVINGFLNRIVVLEEPKLIRPRNIENVQFPLALKEQLTRLVGIKERLGWTDRAREIFEAEKDRVFNETDERKLKLWSRTPEKIIRAATTFAGSRFVLKVDRSDMEIACAMMRLSEQFFKLGMEDAEAKRVLEHADLKLEIERRLRSDFNGAASAAEIKKSFKHNTKHKDALRNVLIDMVDSGILTKPELIKTGGRDKWVHRLIG